MTNGTASLVVSERLLEDLLTEKDLEFERITFWGESKYFLNISHPDLPEGYNGVMVAYYDKGKLKFKRDEDT